MRSGAMPASRPMSVSVGGDDESVNSCADDRYASIAETPPSRSDNADGEAPRLQSIDRLSSPGPAGPPQLPGTGLHIPPEMLGLTGQSESPSKNGKPRWPHIRARKSEKREMAIKSMQSQAAVAAAAQAASTPKDSAQQAALGSTLFTLITYGGIEVIFALTPDTIVLGVCSRTHYVFQTIRLASASPVVSITSNSTSGLLIVAHRDGCIKTFLPVVTAREEHTDLPMQTPVPSGRYRWLDCLTIDAARIFYQPDEPIAFSDRRAAEPGQLIDISSSADNRLLVAHKNQLAVFEAAQVQDARTKHNKKSLGTSGKLLWTTLLPSEIVTAKLSGDGQAIVVALVGDEDDAGSFGARTFIHDMEDGSLGAMPDQSSPPIDRNASVGVVFKPGPFLKHATPVTRLSFRGRGRNTSSAFPGDEGNDLLLTFCEEDSAIRIFNQNGWKQLMLWTASPNSRADWIRGSSAFSLGDLESEKKTRSHGSRVPSRNPSGSSDLSVGAGINAGLRNATTLGSACPATAAGAWIAEVTFRGAFPALRLSRLSYMKRGNDDSQPAHFESVAAILPAGSIVSGSVLNSDDMGLAIHGIWPAWNPWLSEPTASHETDTLKGSAMQFLGLSSVPPPHSQFFGDSYLGGTHSPPTELRITASHPTTGCVVLMEFPLWGDEEFGAMELGSPLRSVLSLSSLCTDLKRNQRNNTCLPCDSMDYDSSRLCAEVAPGQRSIALLWRKQGSRSICSSDFLKNGSLVPEHAMGSVEQPIPQLLEDLSMIPAPLALPPLLLPNGATTGNREVFVAVKWWPDDSFDGPPLLLAVTTSATLVVFEIPPPRYVREPTMPSFDPFNCSSHGSGDDPYDDGDSGSVYDDDFGAGRQEYEVMVTPHPDFGLGLRLESPMDGLPAIAGSFKKHPLNGGMLPAEKTGMIVLGDEVLSVNGVSLESLTFDDIIATVRHVGAKAGPGQPLVLRLRPASPERLRRNSAFLQESFAARHVEGVSNYESDVLLNRRSVMGVSPKIHRKRVGGHRRKHSDGSLTSMLVGSFGEAQQEFGRAIAVIRNAVPLDETTSADDLPARLLVLPWGNGVGSSQLNEARGAALILCCEGTIIYAKRLELPVKADPEKAQLLELGSVDLCRGDKSRGAAWCINSIKTIPFGGEDRCFAVADSRGHVTALFVNIKEESTNENHPFEFCFRHHKLFNVGRDLSRVVVQPASIDIFATYDNDETNGCRSMLKVWNARCDPSCRRMTSKNAIKDEYFDQDYVVEELEVLGSDSSMTEVSDVLFLKSGYLDAFPSLVVFLHSEALVYQRRIGQVRWAVVQRISFPRIPSSDSASPFLSFAVPNPRDIFPHFLSMIQSTLSSVDETLFLLSDWHPENLLAHLFADERGANLTLRLHVTKILAFLWERVENAASDDAVSKSTPLQVAPFRTIGGGSLLQKESYGSTRSTQDNLANTGASLFSKTSCEPLVEDEMHVEFDRLLSALGSPANFRPARKSSGKSKEFRLAMSQQEKQTDESLETGRALPDLLAGLHPSQFRILWAIVDVARESPSYGNMDKEGQFALTVFAVHNSLKKSPSDKKPATAPYGTSTMPSFFQRRTSSLNVQQKSSLSPQCASAGSVSALLSEYQGCLFESIRCPGKKLDWETVRDLRMPFWIRSDDKLRQVSEEVGQNLYRESRDILKAAIFFLAAGKIRTLKNLSAADGSDSGKKFFKFLSSFDFSSERGRSAAEKNAFSLLRKNKYDCAAAFFLLAEPPILKSAVETIASKMEDLDLAFMVARLVGNAQIKTTGQCSPGFGGVASGFGAVLGGGGGYAGESSIYVPKNQKDDHTFHEWKPMLNNWARDLIIDRALSRSSNDSAFMALLLLWVGRRDEAWHWLSGYVEGHDDVLPSFVRDAMPRRFSETTLVAKRSQDPTIVMVNLFVNFVSGPFLLRAMDASARTRAASAMLVCCALCRLGIEIPALRSLAQCDESAASGRHPTGDLSSIPKAKPAKYNAGMSSSTINAVSTFEQPTTKHGEGPPSSIFDGFGTPPQHESGSGEENAMASSIFDSFEVPHPHSSKTEPQPRRNSGMSSSIFDSFDTTRNRIEPPPTSLGGTMPSSIFDSFEGPPRPMKPVDDIQSGQASSSIFDSFDADPARKSSNAKTINVSVLPNSDNVVVSASRRMASQQGTPPVVGSSAAEPLEPLRCVPNLWNEWRNHLFVACAARRMIREIATIGARFHIDGYTPAAAMSGESNWPFIPRSAAQNFQFHADGDGILSEVKGCLRDLSEAFGMKPILIVNEGLRILEAAYRSHRLCFAVLLHLAVEETDLAEDVVRNAAHALIEQCIASSFSNDHIAANCQSMSHVSTLVRRRTAAYLSWQLELCLWFHRGGALPLSALALNESICAVRIGMLVASWNRNFEVLETLLRQPPDCSVNEVAGKQLWTSLKIIYSSAAGEKKMGVGSGGWEFLVDCRRAEATEILRPRPTGCFIIRPHPEDHGVFTLSFKTNLRPTENSEFQGSQETKEGSEDAESKKPKVPASTKRDDVVQHAIIRLSDSGFRCGSFGPFATLMKLLEAVSSSLPFNLRFDQPPTDGVIKEEGTKPSPNSAFFRKLDLTEGKLLMAETRDAMLGNNVEANLVGEDKMANAALDLPQEEQMGLKGDDNAEEKRLRRNRFGLFCELLILSEIRKQLSGVAAAKYDSISCVQERDSDSVGSAGDGASGLEQEYAIAARILGPFLTWCRMKEVHSVVELAPSLFDVVPTATVLPIALNASETEIEISTNIGSINLDGGDAVIRRMIQPGSGVGFRTLRLGEGGESAMVVLFSKNEAIDWLVDNGVEKSEESALKRLELMEKRRVVEPVDLKLLAPKVYKRSKQGNVEEEVSLSPDLESKGIRYRLVDPWEVEPLENREAETKGAFLGRHRLLSFDLGRVATSCEDVFRSLGGLGLLELWAAASGGVSLTKAIATVHPPWERDAGGDLRLRNGVVAETAPYDNSIRQHLYRNAIFRELGLPQRFMALIQVELLDLKNLTSPGGSLSLTVYSLLRLKRPRSTAPLTMKARTLDSVASQPIKLGKATGPNAPASWGSLVRFRFPLPEQTASNGRSYDIDREALFKGPPSVLQVAVYEKKFMSDTLLGGADVKLDGLNPGGQLEEWVPLRTEQHGINWFARIRLTLRFELMCISPENEASERLDELAPSVGLSRIQQLSSMGGMQEDLRKSASTPDLLSYFESMVH